MADTVLSDTGQPLTLPPGIVAQDIQNIFLNPTNGNWVLGLSTGEFVEVKQGAPAPIATQNSEGQVTAMPADAMIHSPELNRGLTEQEAAVLAAQGGMGLVANSATAAGAGVRGTIDPTRAAILNGGVDTSVDMVYLTQEQLNEGLGGEGVADTYSSGGGGGGGYGGGYGSGYGSGYSRGSNGYWDGPRVQYANGWIPPMFGGQYTYQQWLDMQNPPDPYDQGGPAPLPQLPWKNYQSSFDPFNGNPPGNPFPYGFGNSSSGGYGGWSNYGQQQQSDANLPLAKRMYQKFSGLAGDLRQRATPGSPPTQSEYDAAKRQQERDYRANERRYALYNAALSARQNPIWGFGQFFGEDTVNDLRFDQYSNMPLNSLQYLLNANASAKKFETPQKYQKQLQQMYKQINGNGDLSYETLSKNLFSGGRNSLMASLFQTKSAPQAQYNNDGLYTGMRTPKAQWADPSSQTYAMGNLLQGLYGMTMDPSMAYSRMMLAQQQMGNWANRQMQKNPNHYGDLRSWMRKRM